MAGKVPFWVYKQREAIGEISHRNYERQLQDRIRQLEKENSDLKKKIAKLENAFWIAMELLTKIINEVPSFITRVQHPQHNTLNHHLYPE